MSRNGARTLAEPRFREGRVTPRSDAELEYGGRLSDFRVAYSLAGEPGAPCVALLGGISADRRVARHGARPGWWEKLVGEGREVDLAAYRVLAIDYLGGSGRSERVGGRGEETDGPHARSASPAGLSAPVRVPLITPRDQADALACVVAALDLKRLHGVIGASYGGAVALALAARHPRVARGVLVTGAAERSHPMATALRVVQRRIVRRALAGGDGRDGLALARVLAMTTYRTDREFERRFAAAPTFDDGAPRFPVEDYLDHHGRRFAGRFTPEQFLCLSRSMDLHAVDPDTIGAPLTLVSIDPDQVAPRWQMEALAARLPGRHRLVPVSSLSGHDAFLADPDALAPAIRRFLSDPELDS